MVTPRNPWLYLAAAIALQAYQDLKACRDDMRAIVRAGREVAKGTNPAGETVDRVAGAVRRIYSHQAFTAADYFKSRLWGLTVASMDVYDTPLRKDLAQCIKLAWDAEASLRRMYELASQEEAAHAARA